MKNSLVIFVLSLLLVGSAVGQACPKVQTTGPSSDVPDGESAMFRVNVSGGDPNVSPTYNWSVSAGAITSGQGTAVIDVDTKGAGGQTITASVDVGGFSRSCSTSQSSTISVAQNVQARKFDEFNYLGPAKLEAERLDNFAIELQNDPTASAHIILYLGRKGLPGALKPWSGQTVGHLVKRGIDKARISVADGGYRENGSMEVYIVPNGAALPDPSPTVDPSEITPVKKPAAKKPTGKKS